MIMKYLPARTNIRLSGPQPRRIKLVNPHGNNPCNISRKEYTNNNNKTEVGNIQKDKADPSMDESEVKLLFIGVAVWEQLEATTHFKLLESNIPR